MNLDKIKIVRKQKPKLKLKEGFRVQNYATDFRIVTRSVEKSFEEGDLKYRGRSLSF